jgi:hypothetical protein
MLLCVRVDDFFDDPSDPFGDWAPPVLKLAFLQQLRRSPIAGHPDLEVALALTQLAREQFGTYGTDGKHTITDVGSREVLRTLTTVARRLNIQEFDPPFTDFPSFRTYWNQNGGYGSWQARRDMITQFFEPLQARLEELEDGELAGELAEPVSPAASTGWPAVDIEVQELRRHFHGARTAQDYRNIGNDCIAVLEALSSTVYDAAQHLRDGETEPPVSNTKQRLNRYVEDTLPGQGNEELRGLVRKTIEFAQAVKHNSDGTRGRAGIAADAVIQLANILRRLTSE